MPAVARKPRILAPPRLGATVGAFTFWVMSLWPTLLPRSVLVQAVVSALSGAIGWMIGSGVQWVYEKATRRRLALRRRTWVVVAAGLTVGAVPLLVLWLRWQNEQRRTIGLDDGSASQMLTVAIATLVLGAIFVLTGRIVYRLVWRIDHRIGRWIPFWWARAVTVVVVLALVIVGLDAVQGRFYTWADARFGVFNETTAEGVSQPSQATVSGSPDSVVPWHTLGLQGRSFVAGATPLEDLTGYSEEDGGIQEPIRVYVGLDSAPTPAERADLVLAELDRTGAFERSVLAVATATGTGWINPVAATALEYLHLGDTAIVSQQYSFFPSWIAFLVDPALSPDTGQVVFNAVHARWSQLPVESRPRLVVFGESLGSYGTEAAFLDSDARSSLAGFASRTEGALLVGPKASNPILKQLISERDPGSPAWRPAIGDNPHLRVESRADDVDGADTSWEEPRVLYMLHPTDAVSTWSLSHIWRRPDWAWPPVGFGVPERVQWFPIVTWLGESADLMAGFSADPGFGHDYTDSFVASWSAIAPPADWTDAMAARLEDHLVGLASP